MTSTTSAAPPSESELAAILATADRRTLAAVVTHLSGDPNAVPDLRDRKQIERLAAELLPGYLAGDATPPTPSDAVLQAAMNLGAGENVPAAYGPLVREQMGFGPSPARQPLEPPPGFHVLIIGGGVTGVLAGIVLDQLGLSSYTIVEKNPEPGGTWWQNQYPGCRVDTPSLLYSYSFDQDPGWPEHFSHQPELLAYVKRTVDSSGIGARLRCGVEVATLTWDDAAAEWVVDLRAADGGPTQLRANFVIAATGLLTVARWPDIAGRERFAGPSMHSTHWDHSVDLTGKTVAVIGTGASANQIVPAIAPSAGKVLVYQRSPHWMMSHPQYGKALAGDERWLVDHIPTYREWYRFRQFWTFGDSILDAIKIDPNWRNQDRSVNEANDKLRAQLTEYIENQLADKPDLIDKVVPDYPPYAKRMVVDNGWYSALRRDNVKLITAPIRSIDETGIETADGREEVDVIAYATGFTTNRPLWPIEIVGKDGVDLRRQLDEAPEAYKGMALANCPNLLMTYGPHGVPAHGGNGMLFAETAVDYIVGCLRAMFDRGWRRFEVRADAVREYTERVNAEVMQYVWATPGVSSWFKGAKETPAQVVPRKLIDIWQESKDPDLSPYVGA
ncbi:MAG: flavin-containing monooxygenase [Acidimicrobiales bacterium]